MDLWGIERGLIGVGDPAGTGAEALKRHPDRFIPSSSRRPQRGHGRASNRSSASTRPTASGPSACSRPAPSRRSPSTTRRCTRSTPSASSSASRSSAVPASRAPAQGSLQHVELIDEVMYDFPELVFVTRHGCEPWTDLAVKLMLKWPGLHYSTSAFAPKYYPKAIIDYANTRGADKIIYAGYFPMGLSLERIMTEMPERRLQGRGLAEVPPVPTPSGSSDSTTMATTRTAEPISRRRGQPPGTEAGRRLHDLRRRQPLLRGHRRLHPPPRPGAWPSAPCSGPRSTGGNGCSSAARVNRFIPNPTFDPVAKPGSLDEYFRGEPEGAGHPRPCSASSSRSVPSTATATPAWP